MPKAAIRLTIVNFSHNDITSNFCDVSVSTGFGSDNIMLIHSGVTTHVIKQPLKHYINRNLGILPAQIDFQHCYKVFDIVSLGVYINNIYLLLLILILMRKCFPK